MNALKFRSPVRTRVLLLILAYAAQLAASIWLAYELRFDFDVPQDRIQERWMVMLWLVPLKLVLLALFHQFHSLAGYFSTPDLSRMFHALALGSVGAGIAWLVLGAGYAPPRGVILADFTLSLIGLTGLRLLLRSIRERLTRGNGKEKRRSLRVGIIGAGDAGAVLAHELTLKRGFGLDPVAFFDDAPGKWHLRVHDIPVLGAPELLKDDGIRSYVDEVVIAMPSAPARRIGEITRMLGHAHLKYRTVPSLDQLALGQVRVSQLRNVEVQDLLGRDRVVLEAEDVRQTLEEQVVLVTGAGGSIGSELCRQIATYNPTRLVLLDRSEPQLFQIEQELIGLGHGQLITPVVADILDRARMEQVFLRFRPDVIFHAAAHKHVPMMEFQPAEAIQNNSLGSALMADMALEFGVGRFVLISTDKAINPTSVMGASKRLAELYLQALQAENPGQTRFMAVRFGNVLGSSGSVIPLFHRQIAEGGPVKVTHPDMTRYFMTIPEASMLVLQSAAQGEGGEIFVLDMGEPVKIVDLARQMIELSGLKPDVDIQIEFIGVRPGEKLFEELSHKAENIGHTRHPKILLFNGKPAELAAVKSILQKLRTQIHQAEPDQLKLQLKEALHEYSPHLDRHKHIIAVSPEQRAADSGR